MANARIQKTNVTLKMLLDSGILTAEQELVCENPNVRGMLNGDGTITVRLEDIERRFDFLSGAARFIEKRSINGWLYWGTLVNGIKHNLGDFRDQYLELNEP
ncbi:MAG TPA: hypothetical protein VFS25_02730 [Chitinophaga sp.]|uniref:restriction system modified-DNA reader domain-containing protein n=1 Tax=Chitinophaga sp. TaxID=1869181 RepID=UPI002DBFD58D|nr:hypothetical protein [Chitinophaga sp.]HEU4551714.1 hypothetical protein [Chitinophaga sp.]